MKRVWTIAVLLLVAATFLGAQAGLTGKWQGKTPNGMPLALDLVAKGTLLTGTLTLGDRVGEIKEGKVSDNTLTFSVTIGEMTAAFTGELMSDRITLWMTNLGRDAGVVLTRLRS